MKLLKRRTASFDRKKIIYVVSGLTWSTWTNNNKNTKIAKSSIKYVLKQGQNKASLLFVYLM